MGSRVIVGLEIHIFPITSRKVFSGESVGKCSWVSLGFPGTLPWISYEAICQTIKLSHLLNCKINYENIIFDRKNYFYFDLPKGYQITQHFNPIGIQGHISLSNGTRVGIDNVHLEEDTAKQTKSANTIQLDFSRSGRALIEVVTDPSFSTYGEIEEFLSLFRRICNFSGVSYTSYELGEMRVDLNFSMEIGGRKTPRSEIKNLNSLSAIKNSIDFLVNRYTEGGSPKDMKSYTYFWVDQIKKCEVMREKKGSVDYFYIPETNIPRISLTQDEFRKIISEIPFDFRDIERQFRGAGFTEKEIDFLMDNYELTRYVIFLNEKINNLRIAHNWIVNICSGFLRNNRMRDVDYSQLEKTIVDAHEGKMGVKAAKEILKEIIQNKKTYRELTRFKRLKPIGDDDFISKQVRLAFEKYKDQLPTLRLNMPKLERLIIGEVMKQTRGQVDPIKVKKIYDNFLSEDLFFTSQN